MAIKIGKKSEEVEFKLYKGVGAFNVVAVNPTAKELSELTGREVTEEPEYVGKNDDGKPNVRLSLWLRTDPNSKKNNGINMLTSVNFIITQDRRVGANSGKVQIIDKYGRTAWATEDELASKAIPQYSNGPANIDANYRPAFQGEEFFVDFLIQWLNIPNPADYKEGKWVMKADPSDSEVALDFKKLFAGDVSEIKELIKLAHDFAVKCAIGIRTTDEGKQYQSVFAKKFVRNSVSNYSKLDATIQEFKNNGGAANIEYSTEDLHENVVEATNFKQGESASSDNPFAGNDSKSPWDF